MRYLGIDYGKKYIGTAVSNTEGTIAFPRAIIRNTPEALETLRTMISEEKIENIVVGDTRSFSGLENPITKEAEAFAEALRAFGVPVILAWEAGSSVEASRLHPAGDAKDDAAAAIILQRYLDMHQSQDDRMSV